MFIWICHLCVKRLSHKQTCYLYLENSNFYWDNCNVLKKLQTLKPLEKKLCCEIIYNLQHLSLRPLSAVESWVILPLVCIDHYIGARMLNKGLSKSCNIFAYHPWFLARRSYIGYFLHANRFASCFEFGQGKWIGRAVDAILYFEHQLFLISHYRVYTQRALLTYASKSRSENTIALNLELDTI